LLAIVIGVSIVAAAGAKAQSPNRVEAERYCKRALSADPLVRSRAHADLYNAVLWTGGLAAVEFGATPKIRWTKLNAFDEGIRDGLRAGSPSARDDADAASWAMVGLATGALPLASIGKVFSAGDCLEAYDMATDMAESISLTLFLTQATKAISGRERPYARSCDGSPPRDAVCGSDRKRSFLSGHASLAGVGAGLSCAFSLDRHAWGEGPTARVLPCVLGAGAAVTAGVLRIVADKHWGSDVIVGLALGAAIGYFDTWGPFDLLRFEMKSNGRARSVRGVVLPFADAGEIGLRLGLSF
jgi:hypothetical protein